MDKKHSRDLSTLKLQSLLGKREVVLYANSLVREVQADPARVDHTRSSLCLDLLIATTCFYIVGRGSSD
jgi:precorrin-4 methylase